VSLSKLMQRPFVWLNAWKNSAVLRGWLKNNWLQK